MSDDLFAPPEHEDQIPSNFLWALVGQKYMAIFILVAYVGWHVHQYQQGALYAGVIDGVICLGLLLVVIWSTIAFRTALALQLASQEQELELDTDAEANR